LQGHSVVDFDFSGLVTATTGHHLRQEVTETGVALGRWAIQTDCLFCGKKVYEKIGRKGKIKIPYFKAFFLLSRPKRYLLVKFHKYNQCREIQ
jgi:hypothetical protein